jgi:site-specific DNA-methyltransferase (adenine-specific)
MRLELGDCLDKLKELEDNSVDSIVTDPPYGISFMSKKWDYDVPSTDIWIECLRVLKPGGHLLSFSGSRTYHRMVVRIEDAGFEIRDQIMWVYGSGFPKSHNIGKAVDKLQGNDREVVGVTNNIKFDGEKSFYDKWQDADRIDYNITKGTSEWEGWGTALKPAHEPIVMARKPLSEKSVAENVLKWGTGGLNIDESRIGYNDDKPSLKVINQGNDLTGWGVELDKGRTEDWEPNNTGRWPANIIFDEEAGQVLDQQSGISKSTPDKRTTKTPTGEMFGTGKITSHNDKGGASRFFYCPKASKKDRDEGLDGFENKENKLWNGNEGHKGIGDFYPDGTERPETIKKNNHPTVKPTALMLYLIKLVTPVNGVVLDPFMGSGSTGKGAIRGGFDFIGIEKEEEYIKIAEARIKNEIK